MVEMNEKEQEDDHHRSANKMVIEVLFEDAELHQYICDELHSSAPWLTNKISIWIVSGALTRPLSTDKQLMFHRDCR